MKKLLLASLIISSSAFAQTAQMKCVDNGNGTVTCEGVFSDGSSANGLGFSVMKNNKAIVEGKMSKDSTFTFDKPEGEFQAIFDSEIDEPIYIESDDIVKLKK